MICVVVDDLAFRSADAIVRPATARLDSTTPAVRRLETVGGRAFLAQLELQQELAVGAAVVTASGGDLPADFIIHSIIQSDIEPVSRSGVSRAWRSALQQAAAWEFARLTVPPIGTGAGNLPLEDVAEILVAVVRGHMAETPFPREVSFVVETPEEREVFEAILRGGADA